VTKPELNNQQIRALKSRAHDLKPVVRIGQHGLTEAVLSELEIALTHHELLKVKLAASDRAARDAQVADVAKRSGAAVVQRIGNVLVLYRANPEQHKPAARATRAPARAAKR